MKTRNYNKEKYDRIFKKEYKKAIETENILKDEIEIFFKCKIEKTKKYAIYDFISKKDKIFFEIKSRTNNKTKYPTTMIGHNKVIEGLKKIREGYKIFFIFSFTDKNCFVELNNDLDYQTYLGGRYDRGRDEIKKYTYIDVSLLNDF